jgi:hypothetical protein
VSPVTDTTLLAPEMDSVAPLSLIVIEATVAEDVNEMV